MKNIIENNTLVHTFKMNNLYQNLLSSPSMDTTTQSHLLNLEVKIQNNTLFKDLVCSLIRNIFLIEIVNAEITSTKFDVRWSERLVDDPRYCSFEECLVILNEQLSLINNFSDDYTELLKEFIKTKSIAYEIPLDYIERDQVRIHRKDNFKWLPKNELEELISTRKILMFDQSNEDSKFFKKVSAKKIRTKAYLTDRVLTGAHKTNREKRWETHPSSVHFATKTECQKIEQQLLIQLSLFKGAPTSISNNLISKGLLPPNSQQMTCPILGLDMDYNVFKDEILNTDHGRSSFQVGHMRPLKSIIDDSYGHTAQNISWISDHGNRVQGHLSLEEVDEMLYNVAIFKGWIITDPKE